MCPLHPSAHLGSSGHSLPWLPFTGFWPPVPLAAPHMVGPGLLSEIKSVLVVPTCSRQQDRKQAGLPSHAGHPHGTGKGWSLKEDMVQNRPCSFSINLCSQQSSQ